MRPKPHNSLNPKLLLAIVLIASFLLFIFRSILLSTSNHVINISPPQSTNSTDKCSPDCAKIPASLSQAIIHYATSTITPQQTLKEISVTSRVLDKKSPCNFLVFGLGHDSLMWHLLNYGGRTLFLEEDEAWIEQIQRRFPMLESHHVTYNTQVSQANVLIRAGKSPECVHATSDPRQSTCVLALKGLPSDVYSTQWDLIMVDAPTGYYEEAPGRMAAIYTAGMIARNRQEGRGETHVFVHDVNREVEDKFSREFLCEGYMKKQEGRLRQFVIPSHRDHQDKPFCPMVEKST